MFPSVFDDIDAEINHFNSLYDLPNLGTLNRYYSNESFKRHVEVNSPDLSVLHYNIRSLYPKLDALSCNLADLEANFDLLCLCETWLNDDTKELACFEGYESFHSTRSSASKGGGVGIFCKTNLNAKIISNFQHCLPHFECIGVEFRKANKNFLCCEIYRPPGTDIREFLSMLNQILLSIPRNKYAETFICGDYNLNLLNSQDENIIQEFVDDMAERSLLPVISIPTRITPESSTLIDNIFISSPSNIIAGCLAHSLSDHFPIFLICKNLAEPPILENLPKFIRYRSFCNSKLTLFREALLAFDARSLLDSTDPDSAWITFVDTLQNLYNLHFPIKQKRISPKSIVKPWIDRTLVYKIKRRDNLYTKTLRGEVTRGEYVSFRNRVTSDLRRAKINYYKNKFEYFRTEMRKTWELINSVIKPGYTKKTAIESLLVNGKSVRNDNEIADTLNNFFASVGSNISNNINSNHTDHLKYLRGHYDQSFKLFPSTSVDIHKIICSLKNKNSHISSIPV